MRFTLNLEKLADELEFEIEDVEMLLENFFEVSKGYLTALKDALDPFDFDAIAHNAHAIKGGAANLRLTRIASLAKEIELQAKAKEEAFEYLGAYESLHKEIEGIIDA